MYWSNGLEKPVYVSGDSVPLRKEQYVTLIYACCDQSDEGCLIALYNHSAESFYPILSTEDINYVFALDLREAGLFNKKKIQSEQAGLLKALNKRIQNIGEWAASWGNVESKKVIGDS